MILAAPITDSSAQAGAQPVAITYRLPAELQCGHPHASSLTLTFPKGMVLPSTVPSADVVVDRQAAATVTRKGRQLAVGITPPSGVQCDVISQGTVTVVVEKDAGIGNPKAPGTYRFSGRIDGHTTTVKIRLS